MSKRVKDCFYKNKKLYVYKIIHKMIDNFMLKKLIPTKIWLKIEFYISINKKLDLSKPQTFNEKIQWLKLYDCKDQYTEFVDKFKVRKYISDTIGDEYLIPLIGVWDKFEDIDFDKLPNQFVLKPTHTSGNVFICKDKSEINFIKIKKEINDWLAREYYWIHREWPYKNIKPRIVCEKFMVDESGTELKDYKFFCFNGVPKAMFVATDRGVDTRFDFYDMDFNHLPFMQHYKNSTKLINKPKGFDEMVILAKKLSNNLPHVRVDFYDINGKIYFGELTFYHFSGLEKFEPEIYDEIFGSWLVLPTLINNEE